MVICANRELSHRRIHNLKRKVHMNRVLAIAFAVVLTAASAVAQAPAKKYTSPRTPDGQPDLQGYWTNSTYTPLERPKGVTKEFYTKEEAAKIEKDAAERESEETTPGTVADVHYDLTQFGLDRSQSTFASNMRTSIITDPADGHIPPMNASGQKRTAERAAERKRMGATTDQVENMPLGTQCLVMGGSGPPLQNAGYNATYQIVQGQGYVLLLTEMIHDVRLIPIDGRQHLPQNVRQWFGSSIGHWEGDTLVVETTNFTDKTAFRGSSKDAKMTERFTRVDPNTISYTFTISDPATWDKTWSGELPMRKTTGPIFEHACHEGNYGVANTLAGARAAEKKATETVSKKISND
jgi:hypothetical protein